MRTIHKGTICFLVTALLLMMYPYAEAGPFIAYSMQEAERRLKTSGSVNAEVLELGGMTRIAGMVYDVNRGELIVVGQVNEGEAKITLDHFVVAIRALFLNQTWPLVSIDKTPETRQTGKQFVRFEGGIAQTSFARDLLQADVVLKKLALGLLPSDIWGIRSYFALSVEHAKAQGVEEDVSARFWFYPPDDNFLAVRDGVFAIEKLQVGVRTQVMQVSTHGKAVQNLTAVRDPLGDEFAAALTRNYDDLSVSYPEIRRLKTLFTLVALARGIQMLPEQPDLRYWLREYPVPRVETPHEYPLLMRREELRVGSTTRVMTIDGGVELKALVLRLQDGDITALREAVLLSRPKGNALTWKLPLEGWQMPGVPETDVGSGSMPGDGSKPSTTAQERVGTYVTRQVSTLGASGSMNVPPTAASRLAVEMPKFELSNRLPSMTFTGKVGGVMLQGTAKISGSLAAQVDLSTGNFALVVEGQNARLAPDVFRKFVTALWAVYYGQQDPGISIDPIAPGAKKHLVRYIGHVVNSDLGRVMREADYLMKKWAVGTEKPNIPGFKDVDDLMAKYGFRYLGASRRFWFVPEDMQFKRGEDMLLFERGRMTVKTEYVLQNKSVKAEPADEAFAKFFTDRYEVIGEKHSVYKELFEYAKMVALAKYLKEQGVPLFWFLMANKDLVLTEDSPGTVDALAKGSKHFEGIGIEGGVDLRVQGQYVYDQQAVNAVREAVAKLPLPSAGQPTLPSGKPMATPRAEPFSFELGKQKYAVVPQHSLTSGKDRRGIRYQTDLALRSRGEPGLELVRYYQPSRPDEGEFGKGWCLLIPYRVRPAGNAKRPFLNAIIPEKMVVENLLTGEQEVLTFSSDRYSIAGYVPDKLASSQVIGLFLMSNASYRLADKLGNEFHFDQAGYLTDMVLFSTAHRVHVEYLNAWTKAFEQPPYRVEPADKERISFLNVRLPKRMKVTDLIHGRSEVLRFSDAEKVAGYIPEEEGNSRFRLLALLSDASFRLLDKAGNETALTPAGDFAGMAVSPERRMMQSVSHGKQRIDFTYTIDALGHIRIASAHLSEGEDSVIPAYVVRYQYDDEGRLARVDGPVSQVAALQHQPKAR